MKLEQLISKLEYKNLIGKCETEINNICIDSKAVLPGDVFICIKGKNNDGHNHFQEAIYNGAVAIVSEKKLDTEVCQIIVDNSRIAMTNISEIFYDYPSKKLKLIGVTGTNGKTTTCYMIKSILESAGKKAGIIGTLGIYYSNFEIAPELTTPDPICFNKILSDMVNCGIEYVVMEVSAHALYYNKTGSAVFEVGIFTNFSQDHLDFFKTMDNYKKAKQSFFCPSKIKTAVFNFDEKTGREFAKNSTVNFVSYAISNPSDVFAVNIEQSVGGTSFVVNMFDEICKINLRLLGIFNVSNALAAITACRVLGFNAKQIANGLTNLKSVDGRLEYIGNYKGGDIFVDFAHTPEGLNCVLSALRELKPKKLICLFGCGGNRDKNKRALMGEVVAKLADFTVVTSDNPRYEDPLDIISQIEQGMRKTTRNYITIQDRRAAISYAITHLEQGDMLIVAGKGGETFQEIMGIKHRYNDNAVINEILAELK